jgi:hypothetical protein
MVTANLSSYGTANATHTEAFVALPATSSASVSATGGVVVPHIWKS